MLVVPPLGGIERQEFRLKAVLQTQSQSRPDNKLKTPRRYVQQIRPQRAQTFDQHFWPVLVAVCVLCGIAFGAVLTLVRGPWMWGSLLLLPAVAAVAVFFLYRLDDAKLRRSFQLAIIISLAVHLLILVVASATSIFQNDYVQPKQQIAKRANKTIKISNKRIQFVWQKSNQKDTPDPEVELEREQTTTVTKPQPVPVEQEQEHPKPQIVRRETPSQTVPRLDKQLSLLRRQTRNLKPRSSTQAQLQPAAKQQPSKTSPTETQVAATRQPSSKSTQRSSAAKSTATDSPALANQSLTAKRNTRSRPEAISRREPSMRATARIRKSSPRIPTAHPRKLVPDVAAKPKQQRVENRPSKSASQITRRQTARPQAKPSQQNQPKPEFSAQARVARAVQKRRKPTDPGISSPQSTVTVARRSIMKSPSPTTTTPLEAPSRAPDSQRQSRQLNAKTLSVSKSTNGVAGGGISRNLEHDTGGTTSPAPQASDSASRRRTQSRTVTEKLLTSSQKSDSRRSITQARLPTSAFKTNTQLNAKISGSKTPARQTMEASAANVDSTSARHRSQVTAEKGESAVDIGPTKIVADQSARRRSGGGQPDVSRLNPDSTRRSSSRSGERMPTLAESSIARTSAPNNADSSPQSSDIPELNIQAIAHSRDGGTAVVTKEESTATEPGQPLDQGTSQLSELLADARQRTQSDLSVDSGTFDDDDEEERQGNLDTRLAQAPLVRQATEMGNTRTDGGSRESEQDITGDSIAATVIERAAGTLAGSLTRSTASQLLGAAASMPLVVSGPTATSAKRVLRKPNITALDALANSDSPMRSRSNDQTPRIAPTAVASLASNPGQSRNAIDFEATEVAVEHSATAMRQSGAALEVIAPEGAAGLADLASLNLGIRQRPASKDSAQIQFDDDSRFRNEKFGSSPAVSPNATIANDAFRSRKLPSEAGAEPTNERAIQLGLEFLARHQSPDGSWSLTGFDRDLPQYKNQLDADTAATGLALLAFQGAGYNHREFKYARQMNHAIIWLVENQSADGDLYIESGTKSDESCRLYSHAIAALALTEAYGMTQDPELLEPAQKALDFIAQTQDPKQGGWRYYTQRRMRQSDTSVTGWMMMALQSGRLAGLKVGQSTFDGIGGWLKVSADPKHPSQFRYNPYASNSSKLNRSQGRKSSPSMTAVGLLMKIYDGWGQDDPRLIEGAQSLVDRQLPSDANVLLRDTYYWYYATQVLLHVDGPLWKQWEGKLHPLLVKSQEQTGDMAGSWHPYRPVPDRWGIHAGRLYVTTMNLLSLEVKNRKLPLYDDTLKGAAENPGRGDSD